MSSNVQTQINDLNAAVQALDSSLTQITGNTMSNYNQLSRIVAQQANIYNSVYYGLGNMSTGNLAVGANCNITGNLIMNNGNLGVGTSNLQSTFSVAGNAVITGNVNINNGNIFMNRFGNLGIGTTNPTVPLHLIGSANLFGTLLNASNMDLSTATFSNQSQGYIRFGNIMVQWGSIGDSSTQIATFSPVFSAIPYAAFVQRQSITGSGSTATGATIVTGLTTTNITVDSVYGTTDKSAVYWLVIGQIG